MLFQKGDPGDALYGVRRSRSASRRGSSDGNRLTLNFDGLRRSVRPGRGARRPEPHRGRHRRRASELLCCGARTSGLPGARAEGRDKIMMRSRERIAGRASGWRMGVAAAAGLPRAAARALASISVPSGHLAGAARRFVAPRRESVNTVNCSSGARRALVNSRASLRCQVPRDERQMICRFGVWMYSDALNGSTIRRCWLSAFPLPEVLDCSIDVQKRQCASCLRPDSTDRAASTR